MLGTYRDRKNPVFGKVRYHKNPTIGGDFEIAKFRSWGNLETKTSHYWEYLVFGNPSTEGK